jgi:hypothetical protein
MAIHRLCPPIYDLSTATLMCTKTVYKISMSMSVSVSVCVPSPLRALTLRADLGASHNDATRLTVGQLKLLAIMLVFFMFFWSTSHTYFQD